MKKHNYTDAQASWVLQMQSGESAPYTEISPDDKTSGWYTTNNNGWLIAASPLGLAMYQNGIPEEVGSPGTKCTLQMVCEVLDLHEKGFNLLTEENYFKEKLNHKETAERILANPKHYFN